VLNDPTFSPTQTNNQTNKHTGTATHTQPRQQHAERLKGLSFASAAATDELRRKLAKAAAVLRLAEVCRRLETEQEKVLPFWSVEEAVPIAEAGGAGSGDGAGADQDEGAVAAAAAGLEGGSGSFGAAAGALEAVAEEQRRSDGGEQSVSFFAGGSSKRASSHGGGSAASNARLHATAVGEEGREVEECEVLGNFFKRYNKALLDKAAIDREQTRLTKENEDLRQLLKSFLDGISVNDAVIDSPANPLIVVNQRLQLTLAERRKAAAAAASRGSGTGGSAGGKGGSAGGAGQQQAAAPRPGQWVVQAAGVQVGAR
jgi:hypothetical protein